jgi:hypothetical protein
LTFAVNDNCTLDDPCFGCDEAAHAERHPVFDEPGCDTCRLRSLQVSPAVASTATKKFHPVGTPKGDPAWERQIMTDSRGMPLLKPDGEFIRSKEYAEKRHSIEAGRRQVAQETA